MMHTKDIPARFDVAFPEACREIGCHPRDLLGVIFSESAAKASALNERWEDPRGATDPDRRFNAVGLIQFMPPILAGLGFRRELRPAARAQAFRHLDAVGQLPFVVAYFHGWSKTGKPWDSAGRLYQATFLPATLAKLRKPEDVIVERGGFLGWAYDANAVFDADGDKRITIAELTLAIARNARGPRWTELLARLGLDDFERPAFDALAIVTILDVQRALSRLGFDPGPEDGLDGPRTRVAVAAFQAERGGLAVDGIAGRKTREALSLALSTAA
jgi:hypothetical protein